MKKHILLLILVAIGSQTLAQSLLWKIEGKDLKKPSYLFGTIHIQDQRVFNFNDSMPAIMNRVDQVVLELDLSPGAMVKAQKAFLLEDGVTLKTLLNDKAYSALSKLVEETLGEGSMLLYDHIHPFALVSALMQTKITVEKASTSALDMWLYNLGVQMDKKLVAIETLDEQMAIFDNFGSEEILSFIETFDEVEGQYEALIKAYVEDDLETLNEMVHDRDSYSKKFVKALIDDRNGYMAERVDSIINVAPSFVALGAGHLSGKGGFIERFTKMGYSITPMIAPKSPWPEDKLPTAAFSPIDLAGVASIDMPGTPTHNEIPLGEDKGLMHMYMLQMSTPDPNILYSANVVPNTIDESMNEDSLIKLFDITTESTVATIQGSILSEEVLKLNGCFAKKYTMSLRDGALHVAQWNLVSDDAMLILQAIYPPGDGENENIKTFIESFKVTKQ